MADLKLNKLQEQRLSKRNMMSIEGGTAGPACQEAAPYLRRSLSAEYENWGMYNLCGINCDTFTTRATHFEQELHFTYYTY